MQNPFALYIAITNQGVPFTASDGQAFIRLPGRYAGGFYVVPVRSRAFRDWFFHQVFARHDTLPTSRAFHVVLNHLEAEASHTDGNQRLAVWRRVGCRNAALLPDNLLLDLANLECQFVEISPGGWKTTTGESVQLQTSRSMASLPAPVPPPADAPPPLETLRSCLNLPSRAAWLRCLAWLLAAFRPNGPFPVLILQGPPSSGKSFAARILRSLVDPSTSPLTPIPSSVRDLLTLARHNWILAFDHISTLSPQITDALCRLSSGLGATVRETSAHAPEPLQQFYKRPLLLTVTGRWSCPADLAERAFIVTLPPLPPDGMDSRTEDSLLTAFQPAWPAILGALCSAVSTALGRMHTRALASPMKLPSRRLANALAWAVAASPALGCTEEEMQQAFALPAEPHPMVEAVRNLLDQRRQWTGNATELLELLQPLVPCRTPKGVSQQLKKCMLTLADNGIELKFHHLHDNKRIIELREERGGASCEKSPPDAPPDFDPSPQPTETEELTTP